MTGIYQAELRDLAALGARYLQLDDVSLALLCDPRHREGFAAKGTTPR